MRKRDGYLFFCALLLIISPLASASLGISPAKREFYFTPNKQIDITYNVYSDNPNNKIGIFAEGDLTEYTTFDKTELLGGGTFSARINLPDYIEKPGKNQLYIVVSELSPKESFIGTAIKLRALVNIYVPYPGEYIEAEFNIPNANTNEKIPVELKIVSRGTKTVIVNPKIYLYDSSRNHIKTIYFSQEVLSTNEEKYFREYINGSDLMPDDYSAQAIIDYGAGEEVRLNSSFRVGNLKVSIINFTQHLFANEINKFIINVKSNWNGKIESAYADVRILINESESISFRTPSVDLNPWEEKDIVGYFDTAGLKIRDYIVEIKLNYFGQSSYASGIVWISKKGFDKTTAIVIALIFALAIIFYLSRKLPKTKR